MNRKAAELREVWMLSGKEKSLAPAENLTLNPQNSPWTGHYTVCVCVCVYIYIYIYTKQFIVVLDLARVGWY